jgi:hypothetical protein
MATIAIIRMIEVFLLSFIIFYSPPITVVFLFLTLEQAPFCILRTCGLLEVFLGQSCPRAAAADCFSAQSFFSIFTSMRLGVAVRPEKLKNWTSFLKT